MENNKNKKSVKFQGDILNFCDFIQVFVFTRNHHLKDKHGTLKSGTENRANVFNDFFATVFTVAGDSETNNIPLKSSKLLTDAVSSIDKIGKLLTSLNPNNSCGPDECYPRLLKETASILSKPKHDLFTKSL